MMTKKDFEALQGLINNPMDPEPIRLSVNDFSKDLEGRTLLFGYTCDRLTFHVFCYFTGDIHIHVYQSGAPGVFVTKKSVAVTDDGIMSLNELVPDKRLYPQYCDEEFCRYLLGKGVVLPFTTWAEGDERREHYYVGELG